MANRLPENGLNKFYPKSLHKWKLTSVQLNQDINQSLRVKPSLLTILIVITESFQLY